uniref:Uncharacterized protein n=1 Tax=Arundo donax TaxID=35708 RepID=A0A0A9BBG2_ARUDO
MFVDFVLVARSAGYTMANAVFTSFSSVFVRSLSLPRRGC